MAVKRSELIDNETAGYYHLMSRCVRRTFLCGVDKETGQSFEHRRQCTKKQTVTLWTISYINPGQFPTKPSEMAYRV